MNFVNNLFKTEQQRENERKLKLKQGRRFCERNLTELKKQFEGYRIKAVQAAQRNSPQLEQFKIALLNTQNEINKREELILALDYLSMRRDQVESMAQFSKAMKSVVQSMDNMLQGINATDLGTRYEEAMQQAEDIGMQMDDLVDNINGYQGTVPNAQMAEIEQLLEDDLRRANQNNALSNTNPPSGISS